MESVLLNDRYRLEELVGSGGMAVVYRAVDTLLQRQVAVKVLREVYASDPAFLARFQREARAAANLDHPNVVTVYDVGQDGSRHYIVMEYVDGQDLKTLIRHRGRLDVDDALDIAAQICAGVGHAHEAGTIHCDVKPQNVLVTRDGRAKVTDFGIARALSGSDITESEKVWGSPLYFSPEQAAGDPPSPASDVYSIGIVIYEMLAGSPPFQAEKPTALALMHMREEPPPLVVRNPHVPPQLDWLVRKVLAKEPSARFRTAGQLGHVLEEYRSRSEQMTGWQPAIPAQPSAASPAVDRSRRERVPARAVVPEWLNWVLGAVAFVAVVGLIPLWLAVYRAYSAVPTLPPSPTPRPLVTLTSQEQLATVPDVVDMPVVQARRMVERAGFRLVLREERDEPGAERGVVLEQDPPPGESAPRGSEIAVVVSRPPRKLTMPAVVGYPLEQVQNGLESNGLQVSVEEVWSTQPEGMVVTQEPERGTTLFAGDAVTLTVSAGVDKPIPLEVNLADLIVLESAELRQQTFRPGDVIAVTLRWQAMRPISTPYVVFVHLIDAETPGEQNLVAQQDVQPMSPTTGWTPGDTVADPHQVTTPPDLPAGRYELRTGMYPQGQSSSRLPVVDAGLTMVKSDSILITEIEIQP